MNSGKLLAGVLAGVAAGALLGVLFAPAKGTDTRKKISRKSTDAMNEIKEKFDDLLESLMERAETAKQEATSLYQKGTEKGEDLKNYIKTKVQ